MNTKFLLTSLYMHHYYGFKNFIQSNQIKKLKLYIKILTI